MEQPGAPAGQALERGKPRRAGMSNLGLRLIVAAFIILVGGGCAWLGGWVFFALVMLIVGVAVFEFWRMFSKGGYTLSVELMFGASAAFLLGRFLSGFAADPLVLTALILIALALAVLRFPHSQKTAALDFNIHVGGVLYLAWLGAFFLSLRALQGGFFWLILTLASASLFDSGAYLIGSRWGKHPMAPQISPRKSWEGFAGGVVTAILFSTLLAALFHRFEPSLQVWHGLVLGVVMGLVTPMADLAESLFKRAFAVKDTGRILPGHGGMLDRIDSWLWAAPLGFYLITLVFQIPAL